MITNETIRCWNGSTITIQVEDRYPDSGEILLLLDDGTEKYTESLILANLVELRDKIDKTIQTCRLVVK